MVLSRFVALACTMGIEKGVSDRLQRTLSNGPWLGV